MICTKHDFCDDFMRDSVVHNLSTCDVYDMFQWYKKLNLCQAKNVIVMMWWTYHLDYDKKVTNKPGDKIYFSDM